MRFILSGMQDNIISKNDFQSLTIYNMSAPDKVLQGNELEEYVKDKKSHLIENNDLSILKKSKFINETVLWKGDNLGILTTNDNKSILIKISYYGDFFSVVGEKGYYVFDGEEKENWSEMLKS